MLMDGDCLYWLLVHVDIPDLDSQVVARQDVPAIVGEADVRDGGDDFREEGSGGGVLLLFKFCTMLAVE